MRRIAWCLVITAAAAIAVTHGKAIDTLDIYFIDVEGGQSTMIVTPAGQTLLIDAGFPGDGTFQSRPGDPHRARDAGRIVDAARDAGVTAIDYLLVTHFHADHDGGVVELAERMPIRVFVDHGAVSPLAEQSVPGTLEVFKAYTRGRAGARHLEPKPGERIPLKGVEVMVVSTAGSTIGEPLPGAGRRNSTCADEARSPDEPHENPRSTGILLRFGKFRFLDLGDLTGAPLFSLVCPKDLIGPVDVYLVAHHGGADAVDAATFAAFRPRVAVLNNGSTKGGAPEMFGALRGVQGLKDVWQLHRSERPGSENFGDDRIANLDERTAQGIKLSAREDGSFQVTNKRTGTAVSYGVR